MTEPYAGAVTAGGPLARHAGGMRFSIWPAANQAWGEILATASYAEATGWDGAWIADHFMPNAEGSRAPDGPTLEATSLVAALAGTVPRVRIGTLVLGNTYRHPAVVANLAATVDHVSGGRFTLGLGAGWQVNEHEAYGIELPRPGPRIDRFAEAIEVIHGLLHNERTTFKGRYYQLTDAPCDPRPIQEPLPILVGTSGDRMLGIAARLADAWNTWGTPDHISGRSAALSRACDAAGRAHRGGRAGLPVTGDQPEIAAAAAVAGRELPQFQDGVTGGRRAGFGATRPGTPRCRRTPASGPVRRRSPPSRAPSPTRGHPPRPSRPRHPGSRG
jgi:alkanesulfonate monooxygenase SsuD/methylene tetrahydromethanopterin reductase-like flavin-dependent oxidoreductase (luciferase family)